MENCIWIKHSVVEYIFLNGYMWLPKETGGVLIGYRASISNFVITDIIGPGKKAIHKAASFEPDQAFHQKEIARVYRESECLETYLGDWHTHPNSYPYLSTKDKSTINIIANHAGARLLNPLMLIAAPPHKIFKIWIYHKSDSLAKVVFRESKIIVF